MSLPPSISNSPPLMSNTDDLHPLDLSLPMDRRTIPPAYQPMYDLTPRLLGSCYICGGPNHYNLCPLRVRVQHAEISPVSIVVTNIIIMCVPRSSVNSFVKDVVYKDTKNTSVKIAVQATQGKYIYSLHRFVPTSIHLRRKRRNQYRSSYHWLSYLKLIDIFIFFILIFF